MPVASRLDARDIQIAYDSGVLPIITQFTLGIRTGEFIGVVGPNGAGKSTLVRAFSRALRPARGTVLLAGQDLYEDVSARDSARQIGVVPQETAVAFDFSVREIVEMGRTPRLPRRPFAGPTAADDRAVSEALRLAGVEHLSGRSVTSLSGGERQRTMLARALAQEPDVLLLDEPTAHLDLHHQTQTLSLIRHLAHDQGMAVLAVLHDLNLASAFCDRLVLLREGTIAAQGTPEQVLTSACLQHVYGTQVWVRRHPATGRPFLLPLAEADLNAAAVHRTVHVLCGGGTGTALLFALTRERFRVTAGGLNAGDTDAEAADLLGISYPRESPFSALSTETVAETNRLAMLADIVVLSDAPFGGANLAILEAARASRLAGKPVICIQPAGSTFMARDFTGGAAVVLWQHLLSEGATVVANTEAALAEILRISQ